MLPPVTAPPVTAPFAGNPDTATDPVGPDPGGPDPGGPDPSGGALTPVLARLSAPLATVSVDALFPLWREATLTLTAPRPPDFDTGPSLSGRLRGALGRALMVAPPRRDGLPCVFDLLYRDGALAQRLRGWPRPVLLTGETSADGRAVVIRLRAFGCAVAWMDELVPALDAGLAAGLSVASGARARARFAIEHRETAWIEGVPPLPEGAAPDSVTLHFEAPLALDHRRVVRVNGDALVRSVIRRVAGLAAWMDLAVEGTAPPASATASLAPEAGSALAALASAVEADISRLRPVGWTRHSKPQGGGPIPMTGVVGPITLRGPLGPLLPWLHLGQHTHAGRRAAFGLGRYRLWMTDA